MAKPTCIACKGAGGGGVTPEQVQALIKSDATGKFKLYSALDWRPSALIEKGIIEPIETTSEYKYYYKVKKTIIINVMKVNAGSPWHGPVVPLIIWPAGQIVGLSQYMYYPCIIEYNWDGGPRVANIQPFSGQSEAVGCPYYEDGLDSSGATDDVVTYHIGSANISLYKVTDATNYENLSVSSGFIWMMVEE